MSLPINEIVCGDCLEVMQGFPDESVDLVVTDPPYGYSFMGKDWDKAVPSVEVWKECLRVLKSGAFAFVMSSPRQDVLSQMIVRLGQAGFETGFTSIYWAYASGFPKSESISLQIDKRACYEQLTEKLGRRPIKFCKHHGKKVSEARNEGLCVLQHCEKNGKPCSFLDDEFKEAWKTFRNVVGKTARHNGRPFGSGEGDEQYGSYKGGIPDLTIPASPEAKALDGSYGGFQPKPAVEVVIVCMKPLREKTFVDQALANGKGVSWLDDARIPITDKGDLDEYEFNRRGFHERADLSCRPYEGGWKPRTVSLGEPKGRFPANLLVSDDVLNDGKITISEGGNTIRGDKDRDLYNGQFGDFHMQGYGDSGSFSRYFDLDKWAQKTFPFLICPKASKSERNQGCENLPTTIKPSHMRTCNGTGERSVTQGFPETKMKNFHPTVKPLKLMSYLVTLGSRPKDVVLDPFAGSGTTCLASKMLNRQWIGIDISSEYCEIARKRLSTIPEKLDTFLSEGSSSEESSREEQKR